MKGKTLLNNKIWYVCWFKYNGLHTSIYIPRRMKSCAAHSSCVSCVLSENAGGASVVFVVVVVVVVVVVTAVVHAVGNINEHGAWMVVAVVVVVVVTNVCKMDSLTLEFPSSSDPWLLDAFPSSSDRWKLPAFPPCSDPWLFAAFPPGPDHWLWAELPCSSDHWLLVVSETIWFDVASASAVDIVFCVVSVVSGVVWAKVCVVVVCDIDDDVVGFGVSDVRVSNVFLEFSISCNELFSSATYSCDE